MFSKRISIILLLFLLCISNTKEEAKNWTIINNSITIHNYVSNLTEDERSNYYYWIGLRNSFYFADNWNQLEKLVKYFTPEEDNYYKDLYTFSAPCLIMAAVVVLILFIYLVKRFLLKGCQGPKIVVKSYHNTTYFLIGFGFILGLVFLSMTIYNAGQSK